jgi:hypothetical protein
MRGIQPSPENGSCRNSGCEEIGYSPVLVRTVFRDGCPLLDLCGLIGTSVLKQTVPEGRLKTPFS